MSKFCLILAFDFDALQFQSEAMCLTPHTNYGNVDKGYMYSQNLV